MCGAKRVPRRSILMSRMRPDLSQPSAENTLTVCKPGVSIDLELSSEKRIKL